jgi:hypothetical protein
MARGSRKCLSTRAKIPFLQEKPRHLPFILDVLFVLAFLNPEQGRLGNEDVSAVNQLRHLPVEKRKKQGADMRAIHISVGHDDDLVIAELRRIEIILADPGAERGNHGGDFVVGQHLVIAGLLNVENLAFDRKDGLRAPVAPLLGGSSRGVAFDNEDFR